MALKNNNLFFKDNGVCTSVVKSQPEGQRVAEVEGKPEKEVEDSSESESGDESERKLKKKKKKSKKKKKKHKKEKKEEENDFETEVAEALKKQAEEEKKAEKLVDDRKRSYNNVLGYDAKAPTEAEMEAFYRKRQREDDPMLQFMK